ncbi:uncharacterized protein LOC129571330 [Sitodiplosis mosellana]|uniref:uncharacterized protein LOC129571330 n=1 Tax=Sitodiplosis mosellana TaxID=263140 RepID=UPI002444982B|nr:uncharacterized protein LOC129571330 [Sitodiplosis mosellana]
MNLTDLKIDCLEAILEFLGIVDLLNAADTSTRLRRAARLVFLRKYGEMPLIIEELPKQSDPLRYLCLWAYFDPFHGDLTTKCYKIERPKIAFQLLRCFGSLLPSINCFYDGAVGFNEDLSEVEYHFIDYINEFCSETIGTLKFNFSNWNRTLANFNKPFKQVERLCITNRTRTFNSNTNPDRNCLIRLFPRMRSLLIAFMCSPFIHAGCIANHFPNLEELSIYVSERFPCDTCHENYRDVVRLNPQLKKIEFLTYNIDFAEHLQNIEHLDINIQDRLNQNSTIDATHFKNVKHLTARSVMGHWGFFNNYMEIVVKLTFDHLESFTLQVSMYEDTLIVSQLKDFCEKNQSIKKLTLMIPPDAVEFVLRINSWLVDTLPLLQELEFHLYHFQKRGRSTADLVHETVTNILSKFDTVPSISINLACPLKIYCNKNPRFYCEMNEHFLNGFSDVWSVSWSDYKHTRLTFKRRNDSN